MIGLSVYRYVDNTNGRVLYGTDKLWKANDSLVQGAYSATEKRFFIKEFFTRKLPSPMKFARTVSN